MHLPSASNGIRRVSRTLLSGCILAAFMAQAAPSNSTPKKIKLRSQTLESPSRETNPAFSKLRKFSGSEKLSGLYIVQFEGPILSKWKTQLARLNATSLRYLPDDALIMLLQETSEQRLSQLPFIHWYGPYLQSYKLHPRLTISPKKQNLKHRLPVSLLLAPLTPDAECQRLLNLCPNSKISSVNRFGSVLTADASPQEWQTLAESPHVLWIEPAFNPKLNDETATKLIAGDDGLFGTTALTHQLGFTGEGVTVAVADSGIDDGSAATMHPDLAGRVDAFFSYGSPASAADAHSHGTHVSGIIAGNASLGEVDEFGALYGLGVAPDAHLIAQRIFDGVGNYTLNDDFTTLARDAIRAGAHIGSNSWGDEAQGEYDLSASVFDALVRDADDLTEGDQPYILEFSAGNSGPGAQSINSPAVAKNVIATGASQNLGFQLFIYGDGPDAMADFSSRGPAADGRIKPDVTAPGTWIASLQSSSAPDSNAWLPINQNYQYQGGTSQAGPGVSGAAAVFVQYYRETIQDLLPSPALVKAALIHSAIDLDDSSGTGPTPNQDEGWGRVDLTELIDTDWQVEYLDQNVLLTTGQTHEHRFLVGSSEYPLKITLTYTDVPGLPSALPALVNDLDLEVEGPDGTVYRGNQFEEGLSVANAPSFDPINNVEGIYIETPAIGEYRIRIHGRNIVEDARLDTPDSVDQDFALVYSAILPAPGVGILAFDKPGYNAPSQIVLRLVDFDLEEAQPFTLRVTSSSDPQGELITLNPTQATGSFIGTLPTATGPAQLGDGILQIAEGDLISATYFDESHQENRVAQASGDFTPPTLSNLTVTSRFGKIIINFTTDEPAIATIRYGDSANLNLSSTRPTPTTQHSIALENLVENQEYQFAIDLRDIPGNTVTDNNQGQNYRFIGPTAATVLLIDAFYEDFLSLLGLIDIPAPPLTNYTDALDRTGVSYEIWDYQTQGSPRLVDLQPFRVIIWRFPEPAITLPNFTIDEQNTLRNYLEGGGSVFIASMDLLSRTTGDGNTFNREVLKVSLFSEDSGVTAINGFSNNSISSGIFLELDFKDYSIDDIFGGDGDGDGDFGDLFSTPSPQFDDIFDDLFSNDFSDNFVPTDDALPILTDPENGKVVGLQFPRSLKEESGRLVFFGFPLDAIPLDGPPGNNRSDILRKVLQFLAPGQSGEGTIGLDRSIYTIPSIVTVIIADSDLQGKGDVTATVYSDSFPTGKTVSMRETVRRGEFIGTLTLVPATPPQNLEADQLPVQPTDTLRAEYFDASNQRTLQAEATFDVVPTEIHAITVTPDFGSATVRWTTPEPSDSLVQFGESKLVSRTAYNPNLTTEHELFLPNLTQNRLYYFSVTSRDEAGNTTTDDAGGELYTFNTLAPLLPPWTDNLEGDLAGWTVVEIKGLIPPNEFAFATDISWWELGTPSNGKINSAFSGSRAWGSNLNGSVTEAADTFLMTPAVALVGGNQATLKFRHFFDTSAQPSFPLYELTAEVYLTENDGVDLTPLVSYTDSTLGWEEAIVDLSEFVGKTIRIGFYYGFQDAFNIDSIVLPGWVLDDISISMTGEPLGTIEVQSNLAQAHFHLSGPQTRSGSGFSQRFDNILVGTYTLSFDPVDYYTTPAPREIQLSDRESLVVSGLYTVQDSNQNQIPDSWEMDFLGQVESNPDPHKDSDLDGVTDVEEFMAGTLPLSSDSFLNLTVFYDPDFQQADITWQGNDHRVYRIESSGNLRDWTPITDWMTGTSGPMELSKTLNPSQPVFYRLQVHP